METFNFPYHTPRVEYPEGEGIKFGAGWQFSTEPQLPIQRVFVLEFKAMKVIRVNGLLSMVADPQKNLLALEQFYRRHFTYKRFIYPHEIEGDIVVMFEKPYASPKMRPGGLGVSESFELRLMEQPG